MKNKKIFVFVAAILLVSVAFIPTINGMQQSYQNKKYCSSSKNFYDLELIITKEPYLLKNESPYFIYDDNHKEIKEVYVNYSLEYIIKNNYTLPFVGTVITRIINPDDVDWLFSWEDNLSLIPGQSTKNIRRDFNVFCSENQQLDVEKYFADQNVKIETFTDNAGEDCNPNNNKVVKRTVDFFDDNEEDPTSTQILYGLPNRYKTETVEKNGCQVEYALVSELGEKNNVLAGFKSKGKNLEDFINSHKFIHIVNWVKSQSWDDWESFWDVLEKFLDRFNEFMDFFWNDFTENWFNHRFGWTKDFVRYFVPIVIEAGLAVLVGTSCFWTVTTSSYLSTLVTWITSAAALINAIINNEEITENMINAVLGIVAITAVIAALTALLGLGLICGGIEGLLIGKIVKYDLPRLKNWSAQTPWREDIRIYGQVDYVWLNEVVNISCRKRYVRLNETTGKDYTNSVLFDFNVSSKIAGELTYLTPKQCQIIVKGSRHKGKDLKTLKIFSYCFAGGDVYKRFQSIFWIKISRDINENRKNQFIQKFFLFFREIFENRPIYKFLNKFESSNIKNFQIF